MRILEVLALVAFILLFRAAHADTTVPMSEADSATIAHALFPAFEGPDWVSVEYRELKNLSCTNFNTPLGTAFAKCAAPGMPELSPDSSLQVFYTLVTYLTPVPGPEQAKVEVKTLQCAVTNPRSGRPPFCTLTF